MLRLMTIVLVCSLLLGFGGTGCSKKLPGAMKAVPAQSDLVVTVDAQAVLAFAKKTVEKAVPADMKDKIPSAEALIKQVAMMAGVDLTKLTRVTFAGTISSLDRMAMIAEGIDAKGIKGEKQGERNGVTLYSMPAKIHYAELAGLGVAVAPSADMLGEVVDAFTGKTKGIGDTDRGKLLAKLMDYEKDLDQLRAYMLTGKIPGKEAPPFEIKGAGFFASLDKGVTALVISDEAGASKIKQTVDIGLMGLSASLAMGGGMNMPVALDDDTKKIVTNVLRNISSKQDGDVVSLSYRGDLKPLLEKTVALAFKQYQAESMAAQPPTQAGEEEDTAPKAPPPGPGTPPSPDSAAPKALPPAHVNP